MPSNAATRKQMSSTMPIELDQLMEMDFERHLNIRLGKDTQPQNIKLEKETYIIGRADESDIHIPLSSISRKHARLFFNHGEEIIEDLNSTNGTFVNGVRVSRCVLQHEDVIRIGDATLLFTRSVASA